jgi:hypothetical protein
MNIETHVSILVPLKVLHAFYAIGEGVKSISSGILVSMFSCWHCKRFWTGSIKLSSIHFSFKLEASFEPRFTGKAVRNKSNTTHRFGPIPNRIR